MGQMNERSLLVDEAAVSLLDLKVIGAPMNVIAGFMRETYGEERDFVDLVLARAEEIIAEGRPEYELLAEEPEEGLVEG
jgi:hypothetical protein